jgi:hypothetical protein
MNKVIGRKPPKKISKRWPGAGSKGVRKAIYTRRAKGLAVTLAKVGRGTKSRP